MVQDLMEESQRRSRVKKLQAPSKRLEVKELFTSQGSRGHDRLMVQMNIGQGDQLLGTITALIDSGATDNYISRRLVSELGLTAVKAPYPARVLMANGTVEHVNKEVHITTDVSG